MVISSRHLPASRVFSAPFARRVTNILASLVISVIISFLLPLVTFLSRLSHLPKPAKPPQTPQTSIAANSGLGTWHSQLWVDHCRLLTGKVKWITDCTSGFRAITREGWEKLDLVSQGFQIETEMIYEAARNGLIIAEVPINCYWDHKLSRLSILKDGLRTLKLLGRKLINDTRNRS